MPVKPFAHWHGYVFSLLCLIAGRKKCGPTLATYCSLVQLHWNSRKSLSFAWALRLLAQNEREATAHPVPLPRCDGIVGQYDLCELISKLPRTDRLFFASRSHNPGHLKGKLMHSVTRSVQWCLNILQPKLGLIQDFASKTTTPSEGFLLVEGFHHPVLNLRGGSRF